MEDSIMLEACHHYIGDRVFPLMYAISPESAVVRGTGFLLEHESKQYLLTARHVVDENEGIEYSKVLFPIHGPKSDMWSLPHAPYMSRIEYRADFAIIPLTYDQELLSKLYWKAFSMDSFYLKTELYEDQAIFINGFPSELQTDMTANPYLNIGSLGFVTRLYGGDTKNVENYNSSIDIVFDYKNNITIDGEKRPIPKLYGISGSPVFCIDHSLTGLWSPAHNLKILGIEKAVLEGDYIRATKSDCLYKSILKILKEIDQ